VARTYRASLQLSLHDAPNPLDPIGATDWGETRASAFVGVDVTMTDGVVSRDLSSSLVATRAVPVGAVWALFVDRWGAAKPVYWQPVGRALDAGARFELAAGEDRVSIGDGFAVRNVAVSMAASR
jgi:hypothetical protein